MNSPIEVGEPLSKNMFDEYYRAIESCRYFMETDGSYSNEILSINYLENIVYAIERNFEDIPNDKRTKKENEAIISSILKLIESWIPILLDSRFDSISHLTYCYFPILSLLENRSKNSTQDIIKFISKLTAPTYENLFDQPINPHDQLFPTDTALWRADPIDSKKENDEAYFSSKRIKSIDVRELQSWHLSRKFGEPVILTEIHKDQIEYIRESARDKDYYNDFLNLFIPSDTEIISWDILIKIETPEHKYNANYISYLIWTFTNGLESINGVHIELEDWGNGSKWVRLKAYINDISAKIDVMQILKEFQIGIESLYTREPTDKIKTYEATTRKLNAEAKLITKQADALPDAKHAALERKLELYEKILKLKREELELEEKAAELKRKNAETNSYISSHMIDGVRSLTNDAHISIFINEALVAHINKEEFIKGNLDYIDIKESIIDNQEYDIPIPGDDIDDIPPIKLKDDENEETSDESDTE